MPPGTTLQDSGCFFSSFLGPPCSSVDTCFVCVLFPGASLWKARLGTLFALAVFGFWFPLAPGLVPGLAGPPFLFVFCCVSPCLLLAPSLVGRFGGALFFVFCSFPLCPCRSAVFSFWVVGFGFRPAGLCGFASFVLFSRLLLFFRSFLVFLRPPGPLTCPCQCRLSLWVPNGTVTWN